jgi:hypothetical protein
MPKSETKASQRRNAAQRTAQGVLEGWEKRSQLVKKELAAASTAMDVKTARLRALRLAKETENAESAKNMPSKRAKNRRKYSS